MRNKEMAKAFRLLAEGFSTLANAYEIEEVVTDTTVVEPVKEEVAPQVEETTTNEVVNEESQVIETKEEVKEENTYTYDNLESMTYNEIKALAKELGVKAIGTKKIIIESILAHLGSEPTPTKDEPVEVATDVDIQEIEESTDEEVEVVENEVDEDEEVEAEDTTFYDQIVSDLEGYSDEELADILSSVGISPKGKRQALLAKIVQAIEEGVLEWEEDEEATEEPKEEVQDTTNARRVARRKEEERITLAIEKGELSHKEIIKYLKDFNNGRYVSQGLDGDVEEYICIQCDLIDDEGHKHELADPYYVGDDVFCCGQQLQEVDNDLYCEVCGTTYEA